MPTNMEFYLRQKTKQTKDECQLVTNVSPNHDTMSISVGVNNTVDRQPTSSNHLSIIIVKSDDLYIVLSLL